MNTSSRIQQGPPVRLTPAQLAEFERDGKVVNGEFLVVQIDDHEVLSLVTVIQTKEATL